MPSAAPRICSKCNKLSTTCLCAKPKSNWGNKKYRGQLSKLYGSARWKRTRNQRLIIDGYLCVLCKRMSKLTPASHVDHIRSVGDLGLDIFIKCFFDVDKLQSLCVDCHKRKTSAHDSKLSQRSTA